MGAYTAEGTDGSQDIGEKEGTDACDSTDGIAALDAGEEIHGIHSSHDTIGSEGNESSEGSEGGHHNTAAIDSNIESSEGIIGNNSNRNSMIGSILSNDGSEDSELGEAIEGAIAILINGVSGGANDDNSADGGGADHSEDAGSGFQDYYTGDVGDTCCGGTGGTIGRTEELILQNNENGSGRGVLNGHITGIDNSSESRSNVNSMYISVNNIGHLTNSSHSQSADSPDVRQKSVEPENLNKNKSISYVLEGDIHDNGNGNRIIQILVNHSVPSTSTVDSDNLPEHQDPNENASAKGIVRSTSKGHITNNIRRNSNTCGDAGTLTHFVLHSKVTNSDTNSTNNHEIHNIEQDSPDSMDDQIFQDTITGILLEQPGGSLPDTSSGSFHDAQTELSQDHESVVFTNRASEMFHGNASDNLISDGTRVRSSSTAELTTWNNLNQHCDDRSDASSVATQIEEEIPEDFESTVDADDVGAPIEDLRTNAVEDNNDIYVRSSNRTMQRYRNLNSNTPRINRCINNVDNSNLMSNTSTGMERMNENVENIIATPNSSILNFDTTEIYDILSSVNDELRISVSTPTSQLNSNSDAIADELHNNNMEAVTSSASRTVLRTALRRTQEAQSNENTTINIDNINENTATTSGIIIINNSTNRMNLNNTGTAEFNFGGTEGIGSGNNNETTSSEESFASDESRDHVHDSSHYNEYGTNWRTYSSTNRFRRRLSEPSRISDISQSISPFPNNLAPESHWRLFSRPDRQITSSISQISVRTVDLSETPRIHSASTSILPQNEALIRPATASLLIREATDNVPVTVISPLNIHRPLATSYPRTTVPARPATVASRPTSTLNCRPRSTGMYRPRSARFSWPATKWENIEVVHLPPTGDDCLPGCGYSGLPCYVCSSKVQQHRYKTPTSLLPRGLTNTLPVWTVFGSRNSIGSPSDPFPVPIHLPLRGAASRYIGPPPAYRALFPTAPIFDCCKRFRERIRCPRARSSQLILTMVIIYVMLVVHFMLTTLMAGSVTRHDHND